MESEKSSALDEFDIKEMQISYNIILSVAGYECLIYNSNTYVLWIHQF